MKPTYSLLFGPLLALAQLCAAPLRAADPLPSWNEGPAKQAITQFVQRVTRQGDPDYVPPADRVAVFDNDGTLWSEQPIYFQLQFAVDRVRQLAPRHPEWRDQPALRSVLDGDRQALAEAGMAGATQLVMTSHAGMTTDEFSTAVRDWLQTARHPRFQRPYTDLVFQPMLELLTYLRAHDFKTYIASGGGIDFMRVFAESVYGIPPEQVIGSSIKTQFELHNGRPVLVRLPEIDFVDDKVGKPVGIHKFIGRRPLAAFGNSDGDLQMLQWTAAGDGPRFCLLVHHTDAQREWAYDRSSHVGGLNQALAEAQERNWTVVNMKTDWKIIYPFDLSTEGQDREE